MILVSLLACLLLLFAFIGTAWAFAINPTISVSPHTVISDSLGCAAVTAAGKGFTHSTASTPNFADFRVTGDTYGSAFVAGGQDQLVSNRGTFSGDVVTICGLGLPEDVINIVAFDFATGVPSNTVQIESDT
jgi:hypothetical protein